jgi:hypothetical protein
MDAAHLTRPQWTTGPRLLKLGEGFEFDLFLPAGMDAEDVTVYPRFLEQANPGDAFVADGDLSWLDSLPAERVKLTFSDNRATGTVEPARAGNYIARWRAGGEVFHRYFAVIEDDWVVVRLSTFCDLDPRPTLHATGIPLDYRLPAERYDSNDELFRTFLDYHRRFGDSIIPELPHRPEVSYTDRLAEYTRLLENVRKQLVDVNDARSTRVSDRHMDGKTGDLDPGYTRMLAELGVNDHCGLWCANGEPWLGMPEFPYFSSPLDCRKPNRADDGAVVAHQWDFCGGWHFLGPVDIHYAVARGDWDTTRACLREGIVEAENLAKLSGHPAFLYPLYEAVTSQRYQQMVLGYSEGINGLPMFEFTQRYQREMAFRLTKQHKLAYARSIDIADYYRRHFTTTPRTVFVSRTDHVLYDMWWQNYWCGAEPGLLTVERLPWQTSMKHIADLKTRFPPLRKDPLSHEFILVEDQNRQMRFDRECPSPIWWFDYRNQEAHVSAEGSSISHIDAPKVDVLRSEWVRRDGRLTMTLTMRTDAAMEDYCVALWDVPVGNRPGDIESNAKEVIVARNTIGETHLVLRFDLRPDAEVRVSMPG